MSFTDPCPHLSLESLVDLGWTKGCRGREGRGGEGGEGEKVDLIP